MQEMYVEAKLKDNSRLCRVRNNVYQTVGGLQYYKKSSPHITIVPPFYITEDKVDFAKRVIDEYEFEGTHVQINNITVWESLRCPDFVMFDVDTDVQEQQSELIDELKELGAKNVKEPVPHHITLFSNIGWWDEAPKAIRRNIQKAILEYTDVEDTEISNVRLSRRN